MGFPGSASGKEPAANAGVAEDVGSIPGLGRFPWRRAWQSTPVFWPGKSHGQRNLEGYSPWSHIGHDLSDLALTHAVPVIRALLS